MWPKKRLTTRKPLVLRGALGVSVNLCVHIEAGQLKAAAKLAPPVAAANSSLVNRWYMALPIPVAVSAHRGILPVAFCS